MTLATATVAVKCHAFCRSFTHRKNVSHSHTDWCLSHTKMHLTLDVRPQFSMRGQSQLYILYAPNTRLASFLLVCKFPFACLPHFGGNLTHFCLLSHSNQVYGLDRSVITILVPGSPPLLLKRREFMTQKKPMAAEVFFPIKIVSQFVTMHLNSGRLKIDRV